MADSCFDSTMYIEHRWSTETSESQQIKQSKAGHVSCKSRRTSKQHLIEKVQLQLAFYFWSKIVNFPLIFA